MFVTQINDHCCLELAAVSENALFLNLRIIGSSCYKCIVFSFGLKKSKMVYKAIGLMSGSSLDGLDIAYVHFSENAGKWNFEIINADCIEYPDTLYKRLNGATELGAADYLLLDTD